MSGRAFEASGERIDEEIGSRPVKSTPVRRRSGARVSSRGRPPRDASGLHASDAYASSSEVIVSILPTDGDMKARQKRATMAGGISPRTSFTNGLARRRPFMSEMVPHGPLAHRSSFAARQSAMHSQFITLDADPTPVYKRRIAAFIDGTRVTLFMTAVTLWTLFGDDIRLLAFAQEDDRIFVYVVYVCFFLFALEMILACVAKRDYPVSFFFWLDTMATMSLLIDIPEFMAATGFPECYHDADFFMSADWSLLEHSDLSGISSESIEVGGGGVPTSALDGGTTGAIARAGRAARVGTRLGRILRMVRLLRVFKLYKSWHGVNNRSSTTGEDTDTKAPLKTKKTDTLLDDVAAEAEDDEILRKTEETRVGARLSDLTTRRVIVGVLALLFMLPLFDLHTYDSRTGLEHGGLRMLHTMFVTNPGTERSDGFYDAVETYASQAKGMYALVVDGVDFSAHPKTDFTLNPDIGASLRCEEHQYTTYVSEADGSISYAFFEMRDDSRLKASLNMGRTAFVCFVLGLGAMLFSKDANTLVLKPIERMVKKVREVSENPLKRFEVFEDDDDGSTQMETRMLENSIAKICGLLAVGFGEAGSEVIAENMKRGGEINPMIPGKKIVAIFGFCDIRQFTDTTEARTVECVQTLVAVSLIHAGDGEAFGDDDQRRTSAIMGARDLLADLVDRHRHLGDADDVGPGGHPGVQGDPSDMTAHDLGDHAPLVRIAGGAQAVHRVRGDVHRGVEAEGVVGGTQIVVDRLRHAEHVDAVLGQPVRGGGGSLAADGDDAVEAVAVHRLGDVLSASARTLVGVRATGAEDRAPDLGQALDLVTREREEVGVHDAPPAVTDADELKIVSGGALEHDAADDGVQARAVAAAGQDSDLHAVVLNRRDDAGRRCLTRH